MTGWIGKVFAPRTADPALARLQLLHAARAAKVPETVERATAIAEHVVREGRDESMRASFRRAASRLDGE